MSSVVLLAHAADEGSGYPVVPRFLRLVHHGWDAHLACLDRKAKELRRALPPSTRGRTHGFRRRGDGALRSLLVDVGAGLVHFPSAASAVDGIGSTTGLATRVVLSFCGADLDGATLDEPSPYSELWKRADAFHFESEALAELAPRLGGPVNSSSIVPPLVDRELLAPPARRREEPGELRILSIGPLAWRQGYEYALSAIRLLRDRGLPCRYRIVGSGEFVDAVFFARHQLGLREHVELVSPTGCVLREQLAWADVFVNPAVTPTSPKMVLDAQASGLPVVTTEPPLAGRETALLVPRRDPEALADKLALLMDGASLRRHLAEAGREAAGRTQSLDEQLDRFRDLYRAVLAAPRCAG